MSKEEEKLLILHFGELWLRGRNRNDYIRALKKNVMTQMKGEDVKLLDSYDRLILRLGKKADIDSIRGKASKIFGVSAFEIAYSTKPDMRHIVDLSGKLIKKAKIKRLKINSHRSYKGFKFNSIDIIKKVIGKAEKLGIEPDLREYDGELFISVTKEKAYVFLNKEKGAGGLPSGTSGRCVVLLSGGIDSPVAAWYAMKRGLTPIYVHLHGFSDPNEAVNSKISSIVKILSGYSHGSRTYFIPSHVFQMAAIKTKRYELVLMKAFMLRIAERIAEKEGAEAIITGDSLGQVASQTMPNLASEQQQVKMPILRPLIGLDKLEIIDLARRIGTYEESIKPYKDVCSINARNPTTHSSISATGRLAKEIKIDSVVTRSLKKAQISTFNNI